MKARESEVMKEAKVVSGMGLLALVAKVKTVADDGSDSDHSEYGLSNEDFALMVSNPKRFARNKFPSSKIETGREAIARRM